MSTSKQGGSSRLGRDSQAKRLGVKINQGEKAGVGQIIVRQRGSKFVAGKNVKKGGDDTIYAMTDGLVKIATKAKKLYDGTKRLVKVVNVEKGK
jgi:large subunit ribosomal protein L27